MTRPWQREAYELTREIPEIYALVNIIANAIAQRRLVAESRFAIKPSGDWTKAPEGHPSHLILEHFEPLEGNTIPPFFRRMAMMDLIYGEGFLIGQWVEGCPYLLWEMVSPSEIAERAGRLYRRPYGDKRRFEIPVDTYVARMSAYGDPPSSWIGQAVKEMREFLDWARLVYSRATPTIGEAQAERSKLSSKIFESLGMDETDQSILDNPNQFVANRFTEKFIDPCADRLSNFITEAYLRPMLKTNDPTINESCYRARLVDLRRESP